jgi:hypothetical protein
METNITTLVTNPAQLVVIVTNITSTVTNTSWVNTVDKHPWVVQGATGLIVMVSACAALLSFLLSFRLKRMDVRLSCQKRWNDIAFDMRLKLLTASAEFRAMHEKAYFEQFWAHQWDQFHYWEEGLLDTRTFMLWMRYRYIEHRNPSARIVLDEINLLPATKGDGVGVAAEDGTSQTMTGQPVGVSGGATTSERSRTPPPVDLRDDGWTKFGRRYVNLDGDGFVEFMDTIFAATDERAVMSIVVKRRGWLPRRAIRCIWGPFKRELFAYKHRH